MYASFAHQLDFAAGREIDLICEDGIVRLADHEVLHRKLVKPEHDYTPAELESARRYAEYHLNRIGEKFVRCDF